ncbi:hypothetical protein HWI79_3701 [Cryptosporidium felis]|nr:hypothetical protein HWI79_3701 [Cryptosporidium felis]
MGDEAVRRVAEKIKSGSAGDGTDFLLLTDSAESCVVVQEVISELLDYDIFCMDWEEFGRNPAGAVGGFPEARSLSFACQEPLVEVLGRILSVVESALDAGLRLETRIYVPYGSELHVEYARSLGLLREEVRLESGRRILVQGFGFESMLGAVRGEFPELEIAIETVGWLRVFYCDSSLLSGGGAASAFSTCVGAEKMLLPFLEADVDWIYDRVLAERKSGGFGNYSMPALFSRESARKDLSLLGADNLPIELRAPFSRHVLQLFAFIQQLTGKGISDSGSRLRILSMGPTSRSVSRAMERSYAEICRKGAREEESLRGTGAAKDEVTLLIMDRTFDLISPIYSPIRNINDASEGAVFSKFDDGIIEFLDEYLLWEQSLRAERPEEGSPETRDPSSLNSEEGRIYQVTNPVYLSIMLDPDKLQKDLILSQNYPVLSFRLISVLEDFQGLLESGKESFSEPLKGDVSRRILSVMGAAPMYDGQPWKFLLQGLNQSHHVSSFWREILQANYYGPNESLGRKRAATLGVVLKYLGVIQQGIFPPGNSSELGCKSPSTKTSTLSSSQSPKPDPRTQQAEEGRSKSGKSEEIETIGGIISRLLAIRERLLPDSVTNISKKLESLSSLESPQILAMFDMEVGLSALLGILHVFIIPMVPFDSICFSSIHANHLKRKFTSSSFEHIAANYPQYSEENPALYLNKITSLAASCSSYEGPDCRIPSVTLKPLQETSPGGLDKKLASIRGARKSLKNKQFRNFQLFSLLPASPDLFDSDPKLQSLVAQTCQYVIGALYSQHDGVSKEWLKSDLEMLDLQSSASDSHGGGGGGDDFGGKNKPLDAKEKKTLIVNIIGSFSLAEAIEVEKLASKCRDDGIRLVALTDQVSSPTSITKSLLYRQAPGPARGR